MSDFNLWSKRDKKKLQVERIARTYFDKTALKYEKGSNERQEIIEFLDDQDVPVGIDFLRKFDPNKLKEIEQQVDDMFNNKKFL